MFKDDYKKAQETMHDLTEACFANHKAASDGWEHGEPVKAWWDASGTLCIEYESGNGGTTMQTVNGGKLAYQLAYQFAY